MEYAMEMIAQHYLACKKMKQAMEAELSQIPKGNLTYRTVKGHRYCYLQFYDGVRRRNQAVSQKDVEEMEKLFERKKFLKSNVKVCEKHLMLLEKVYPQMKEFIVLSLKNVTSKDSEKPYLTAKGDYVRSKSEVIIANELYMHQIYYEYEKPLPVEDGRYVLLPDFTICTPIKKKIVYWEHCGLMSDPNYRSRWDWKKQKYEKSGISDWQKNLIVTYELQGGDFRVEDIQQQIARLLRE